MHTTKKSAKNTFQHLTARYGVECFAYGMIDPARLSTPIAALFLADTVALSMQALDQSSLSALCNGCKRV
ncbi:MAG TPA: hypothetical protein DIW40_13515 [Halomonas sp.]|nr:hypothetical protein [Halomonas sp.]